jgi:copper chaperone NosL
MNTLGRRRFLKIISMAPLSLSAFPAIARAMECRSEHPLTPPRKNYHGQCPVCGMVRPMWARTWIRFEPYLGVDQVCSFHCLADWILKTGREPKNIVLAVYHEPEKMIPADQAVIVLGSAAAGTMSPISKIVFDGHARAMAFSGNCGGEIVDFPKALEVAKAGVVKENQRINARRLKKGKIVEPSETDECPVCHMVPARYPHGKCQIQTRNGKRRHFCSTQCLFAFLGKPSQYADHPVGPFFIWVVDRNSGIWIGGRTAFYVIGSSKVFGPMGYEAFPFNSLNEAREFAAENGGKAVGYGDVTIREVVPEWRYHLGP